MISAVDSGGFLHRRSTSVQPPFLTAARTNAVPSDVREEELVDEVIGHVLRDVGALEAAGREQGGHLLLDLGSRARDLLESDADHDEGRFALEEALEREAAVSVVPQGLDPIGQPQGLVLKRVRQLVREDQPLGEVLRIGAGEAFGALDDEEAPRLGIVEGHHLRCVEVDQRSRSRGVSSISPRATRDRKYSSTGTGRASEILARRTRRASALSIREAGTGARELASPNLLDAAGNLGHPVRQEVRGGQRGSGRQGDSGQTGRAFSEHDRG